MIKKKYLFAVAMTFLFGLGALSSCSDSNSTTEDVSTDSETSDDAVSDSTSTEETFDDWTEATHSKNVDPNFDEVFDDASVMRIDIVMDDTDWNDMQDNLASVLSSTGSSVPGGFPGGAPGGAPGGQTTGETGYVQNTSLDDPDWFSCSVFYNDIEWYHVGVRYKGNSSLQQAYQQGSNKLSFKFNFDKYEDDYPTLKNQRFYGFKKLSLNNNYLDESCMREKVTADLFRKFGLAAPHTRFCVVYVNHGSGAEYYGIYALVEAVDDTVIDTQFDDNDGNLYKPEGDAASFGIDTYEESEFYKKTNEDDADYSDVFALYTALHDSTRITAPDEWKANLETVLDVPVFLKWLAANTVIQNWDTYGNMTHNYYLYNDPTTGLLNWIPWDNNEALNDDNRDLPLDLTSVSDLWPLINYLMDDSDYMATYKADVQAFIDECYNTSTMDSLYDTYSSLLQDYASQENNSNFSSAVSILKQHVSDRATAVSTYLSE